MRTATSPSWPTAILEEVLEFQQGSARDDIAVVAVRVPEVGTTVTDREKRSQS